MEGPYPPAGPRDGGYTANPGDMYGGDGGYAHTAPYGQERPGDYPQGGYGGFQGGGGGGYGAASHGYQCEDISRVPPEVLSKVDSILSERASAKMRRDFDVADRLRVRLSLAGPR